MAGFSDYVDKVSNVFGEIASVVSAVFAFLWNTMLDLFTFLWNTLVSVVGAIVNVFQKAQTFLTRLWNDYLKIAFDKIWKWLHLLVTHPIQAIQQLNDWIHKIRQWYDTHILPILKRQQQMLQHIRGFLVPLRILHVKWAQKLDNYLQDAEARIAHSIEIVRGSLNRISDWIAIIAGPDIIIRRNTLGAWLLAHLGLVKRIVGYGGNRPLTLQEQKKIEAGRTMYHTENVAAHLGALTKTGLTADDQARVAEARAGIAAATGQALPF